MSERETILEVRDLQVSFRTDHGPVHAVNGVTFDVRAGEVLAIVGESGCGKSATAQSIMGLNRGRNASFAGSVAYRGADLLTASDRELQAVCGDEIAMIFQDPMSALNPVYRVGWQIDEQIRAHRDVDRRSARSRTVDVLGEVGIPRPGERVNDYPHQFSGGMRQRAMIAMGLSNGPRLLIADEPTTALDVTVQAQILDLLDGLRQQLGAVVLITHDLGVVASIADRVIVMYAGRVIESGTVEEIFEDPQHPYTWGLLECLPRVDAPRERRLPAIEGAPPMLDGPLQGCSFAPRCVHRCDASGDTPALVPVARDSDHIQRCWRDADDKRARRAGAGHGAAPSTGRRP